MSYVWGCKSIHCSCFEALQYSVPLSASISSYESFGAACPSKLSWSWFTLMQSIEQISLTIKPTGFLTMKTGKLPGKIWRWDKSAQFFQSVGNLRWKFVAVKRGVSRCSKHLKFHNQGVMDQWCPASWFWRPCHPSFIIVSLHCFCVGLIVPLLYSVLSSIFTT